MDQQPFNTSGTVARRGMTLLFNLSSWGWGSIGVLGGCSRFAQNPVVASLSILCGLILIPPIRRFIGRAIGVRVARRVAIGSGLAILALIMVMGRDIQIEEAIEEERVMKLAQEEERRDSILLARYPFLERDSLHAWKNVAGDSVTNPRNRFDAFIREQEEHHVRYVADSIARALKWHEDSIVSARQYRADSIKMARAHIRDSIAQAREARRAAAEQARSLEYTESSGGAGTYNGRTIYIGPRGGRYYINSNGNKTYIK